MSDAPFPQLIDSGSELSAAGLVHRVSQPQTPGPYPTAVLIHGRAGTEDVMWVFRRAIPHSWLVVAPRAILGDPDGGYCWTPEVSRGEVDSRQSAVSGQRSAVSNQQSPVSQSPSLLLFDDAVTAVKQFIKSLPALYNADPDRVVLMGFSQGAAVSFAVTLHHPGLVKGIASLVGFMPEGVANLQSPLPTSHSPLSTLPIFMAVGKEDPTIPLEKAREAADILRTTGADLTYHEYDTGHKLNAQGTRDLTTWWSARG